MAEPLRTVVISEPHIYHAYAQYGGHQYAKVFAEHGWQVAIISSSFNLWRLILPKSGVATEYLDTWRAGGKRIDTNIVNYCFAHLLPTRIRYLCPLNRFAHLLYVPNMRSVLESFGVESVDLLWLHGNEDWLYRKAIPHSKLIVRVIDNYAGFGAGYDNYHPLMKKALREADGVFTCSHYVRDLYSAIRSKIEVIPNGVEVQRFQQPSAAEPAILAPISRPRITYVGAIAAWFDLDLVCNLARAMPVCNFVIIGPWHRSKPTEGTCPPNLHILGQVPYESVPEILAHSDVGIVPFVNSELVQGISPIKVYEYMAAGLPVVSTRWRELELQSLPIALADNLSDFVSQIESALMATPENRAGLRRYALGCSWEQRLKTLLDHVGVDLDGI